ncbi:30S ribosomal protein S2 [Candidatus Berkelbacteria bacterium]|nr:30S ribosomal protein S2 [Candidatus Berkelbacteria bacterium]
MSKMPTLEELFRSGAHFGHQKFRSSAQARKYVFQVRDGVMIFDLEKTAASLKQATDFLSSQVKQGKLVLLVGTKRQFRDLVTGVGQALKIPYIAERWPGGMLTNFETIRRQIVYYNTLLDQAEGKVAETLTKKERRVIMKRVEKMAKVFEGVRTLDRITDVLLVVGATTEFTAITEAAKLKIPTIAITDSDVNPDLVTYPVPANDDSRASVELLLKVFKEAIEEAQSMVKKAPPKIKGKKTYDRKDKKAES